MPTHQARLSKKENRYMNDRTYPIAILMRNNILTKATTDDIDRVNGVQLLGEHLHGRLSAESARRVAGRDFSHALGAVLHTPDGLELHQIAAAAQQLDDLLEANNLGDRIGHQHRPRPRLHGRQPLPRTVVPARQRTRRRRTPVGPTADPPGLRSQAAGAVVKPLARRPSPSGNSLPNNPSSIPSIPAINRRGIPPVRTIGKPTQLPSGTGPR